LGHGGPLLRRFLEDVDVSRARLLLFGGILANTVIIGLAMHAHSLSQQLEALSEVQAAELARLDAALELTETAIDQIAAQDPERAAALRYHAQQVRRGDTRLLESQPEKYMKILFEEML